MNIIEKPISEIQPYEGNPRKNTKAVQYVAESIKAFGFKVPVIIDRDGIIVAGHTRVLAAQQLGMTSVPCLIADDLTPEQIKAFRLADNKVTEFSSWDLAMLSAELSGLDLDMTVFGFDTGGLDNLNIDDMFKPELEKVKAPKIVTCPHCGEMFET